MKTFKISHPIQRIIKIFFKKIRQKKRILKTGATKNTYMALNTALKRAGKDLGGRQERGII